MTSPDEAQIPAPDLVSAGAQAIVENANRLGLTWQMRIGTIIDRGVSDKVQLDGDDTAIGAVPLSGNPAVGQRVYVISVPPGGAFIVGQVAMWESGSATVTFAAATSNSSAVIFNRPFLAQPRVFLNINSGSGNTSFWFPKAFNITTTGFTLHVFKQSGLAANAWTGHAVQWFAVSQ